MQLTAARGVGGGAHNRVRCKEGVETYTPICGCTLGDENKCKNNLVLNPPTNRVEGGNKSQRHCNPKVHPYSPARLNGLPVLTDVFETFRAMWCADHKLVS